MNPEEEDRGEGTGDRPRVASAGAEKTSSLSPFPIAEPVRIFSDGASRGNPGPAAIGVVIDDAAGNRLAAFGRCIGRTTNNVAEYRALLAGLDEARRLGARRLRLHLDSELAVRQLSGEYRVRHPDLIPLYDEAKRLIGSFEHVDVVHVPRALNREADALANRAMDEGRQRIRGTD